MPRGGKWEPPTVLEKADEPRSYTLKTENGRTYRQNRSHILKTEVDEDHMIEISHDDNEKETSEENVTVQSDDTLKDVKWEESEVNDRNRCWHNRTKENNKIRKGAEKTKTIWRLWIFLEGECDIMYIFVGHLLDSDIFSSRLCYNWWLCIWLLVKLVNMLTTIYVYSLYGNISINYGNYALL